MSAHDDAHYLYERYPGSERRGGLLRAYYTLRPLIPRPLQLALRRAYAPRQARREFPAWPIEPILVERRRAELRERIAAAGGAAVPLLGEWPAGATFAAVLTHDVEGPRGIENIPRVRAVERRHGFASSWNFVAEDYPIPPGLFDELRADGCEVGLHGITHDGRLFEDRRRFDADLPKIHRYLREWGAAGFRSPATHRNADWMPELGCLYDSSFPDTDPFEPQSGGCCSILPFFIGDLVELPITLPQDHTLFEILRDRSIARWVEKTDWIVGNRGLVNLIVHPDYVVSDATLRLYDEFLAHLRARPGGWHALPREVAEWWRLRAGLRVEAGGDGARVVGPGAERATLLLARERAGEIVIEEG